jgi:hypothetical protein
MQRKPNKRPKSKKWVILGTNGSIIKFEPRSMRVIYSQLRNNSGWDLFGKEIIVTPDART